MHTEIFDAPQVIETHAAADSPHLATIRGHFMSEGARSANKRLYVNTASWLAKAQAKLAAGGTIDMRTHHEAGDDTTRVFGRVSKIGTDGTYEATVVNNTLGREILPAIKGGYLRHVSLRASRATAAPMESRGEPGWVRITDIENLVGIDLTNSPGIAQASVAVMESAGDTEIVLESFELHPPETADVRFETAAIERVAEAAAHFEREYSAAERKKAGRDGAALPDGSFPIYTPADVNHAGRLWNHSTNPKATKTHIIHRAKALGAVTELPYDWRTDDNGNPISTDSTESTTGAEMKPKTETDSSKPGIAGAIAQATESTAGVAGSIATAVESLKTDATEGETVASLKARIAALEGKPTETPAGTAPAATESTTTSSVSASLTEASLATAVEAVMERERRRFEDRVQEMETKHKSDIEEILASRRKTVAVSETEAADAVEKLSLGQAVAAYLGAKR